MDFEILIDVTLKTNLRNLKVLHASLGEVDDETVPGSSALYAAIDDVLRGRSRPLSRLVAQSLRGEPQ